MSEATTITREQIFQLLADAGATRTHSCCGIDSKLCSLDEWRGNMEAVVKMAYAAGQQAEREACVWKVDKLWAQGPMVVIAAIRARGEKP